jgi:hypothetical protein
MTCRSRSPIFGPLRVLRTSKRVPGTGSFPEMLPYDPVTQAPLTAQIGTSGASVQNSLPRVER